MGRRLAIAFESAFLAGDFEQSRIELDESIIDRTVLRMAGIACGRTGKRLGGSSRTLKAKEGPLAREAALVFHFHFEGPESALIVPLLIDRTLTFRGPHLDDEHRLIRPFPGGHERAVG